MSEQGALKISLEEGQQAMYAHAREKGYRLFLKYGKLDELKLQKVLQDEEFVRYPTKLIFDSSKVEEGMFAVALPVGEENVQGYIIYLHETLEGRKDLLPKLVLYHLVTVNYGEFSNYETAEEFAAAALDMDKEVYYKELCEVVDSLWK